MADLNTSADLIAKTGLVAGEVLLPGASNLIAGNITTGVVTFLATGILVSWLAPTAPLLAAAASIGLRVNSLSQATTGHSVVNDVVTGVRESIAPNKTAAAKT
jgi:hypothetical protein